MQFHIVAGGDHKAKSAAGGIVAQLSRLRRDQPCHHVDQHPRCEILAGAALLFVRVLFQEPLVQVSEAFFLRGIPVELVDGQDDFLQVFRLVDIRLRPLVNLAHTAGALLAQVVQQLFIVLFQFQSALVQQAVPAVFFRNGVLRSGFLAHFQEKDIRQLRHVLMIRDPVVPEHVAQIPKFRDDFLIVHKAAVPPSS